MSGRRSTFKAKRIELKLTYGELARFLGVTVNTIRNWEIGQGEGNSAFEAGAYDAEIQPLLQLLPHSQALAYLPTELKTRLLTLHPLLAKPNAALIGEINSIITETLEESL